MDTICTTDTAGNLLLLCLPQALRTATPEQLAAALHELHITQHIAGKTTQQQSSASASLGVHAANNGAEMNATSCHPIVQLQDSLVLQQTPQQQQQALAAAAAAAAAAAPGKGRQKRDRRNSSSSAAAAKDSAALQGAATQHDGSSSCAPAAVVLVFEPLQQGLAWVLQFIRQR
jgi:hypothetical protein